MNKIQLKNDGQILYNPSSQQYYIKGQNQIIQNEQPDNFPSQVSQQFPIQLEIQYPQALKKINSNHEANQGSQKNLDELNLPKRDSSLSQTFLKSFFEYQNFEDEQISQQNRKFKCLVANDEEFQLQMKVAILKKINFKVHKAENGQVAFNKVRYFIENYNKVRQRLQHPDANYKNLNSEEQKLIQTTLKNYDLIILDLNMPILNGYQACQRICEVYQSFNSLPDYDDIVSNSSKEVKHLQAIHKVFLENDIPYKEDSDQMSQISPTLKKEESKFDQNQSQRSLNDMIRSVKEFYEFRRLFNGILRVRPLMVACSADISPEVIKQAKQSGFDIVIQAPLSEQKIKEKIIVELEKKHQIQARMKEENFNHGSFQSQIINNQNLFSIKFPEESQKSASIKKEKFLQNLSNEK